METNAPAPAAPPAEAQPAAPAAPPADARLPESFNLPADTLKADLDKYFDEPVTPAATVPPAAVPAKEPAAEAPTTLIGKLSAKKAPAAPAAAPAAAAAPGAQPEDPIAAVEAEMQRNVRGWKPAVGWEKLKSVANAARQSEAKVLAEATSLKTRVAELETKLQVAPAGTSAELETTKAQLKTLSDRLLVLDLESHPSYRAQYIEPREAEVTKASELLAAHNVKADLNAILAKPRGEIGKALAEILKDVPEFDRVEIADAIRKAHQLDQGAKQSLSQAATVHAQLKQQGAQRQKQSFEARWLPVSAAVNEHIVKLEAPATATPEERASVEAYNQSIDAIRGNAEKIALAPASEEAVAEAAIKAAAYDFHIGQAMPRITREFESVVEENRKLVAELNAIKGRNPNRTLRAAGGSSDGASETDPAKMDHKQAAEHFFNRR